ncbi:MAG TPA: hypothetical protein VHE61_09085 [Opitutaceae bacterium]|nr:hypothetical protein [Opitutaceae bacterium]
MNRTTVCVRRLMFIAALLAAALPATAAEEPTILSLVGRRFLIEDTWTGQELLFRSRASKVRAVWRVCGSGVPRLSEVEYGVTMQSPRQCVFIIEQNRKLHEVVVNVSSDQGVRVFIDGFRVWLQEGPLEPNPLLNLRRRDPYPQHFQDPVSR